MGGLGTTYTVHLRFIGKLVVDFPFMLIELFVLGVTAEALRAKIKFEQSHGLFATAKGLTLHRVPKKLSRFAFVRTSSNFHKFR